MQQALEVIKGADGAVTQHFIEFLWNGVPLLGRHQELSKLGEGSPGMALLSATCFLLHKVPTRPPLSPANRQ